MSTMKNAKQNKPIFLSYVFDNTGCGMIRNTIPASVFNTKKRDDHKYAMATQHYLVDPAVIAKTGKINFQRFYTDQQMSMFEHAEGMRKHVPEIKICYDIDDLMWNTNGEGIPDYNAAGQFYGEKQVKNIIHMIKSSDIVTTSTQYLADKIQKDFGKKCKVLRNTVSKAMFHNETVHTKNKIPKVLFSGTSTHYSNKDKHLGDFAGGWSTWLVDKIKNDKIEFNMLGKEVPFFLEEVKDKVILHEYKPYFDYAAFIRTGKWDLAILPLIDNEFNKCKSNIRLIECQAAGIPTLASVFEDGPYQNLEFSVGTEPTKKELNSSFTNILKNRSSIIEDGHDNMNLYNFYTESDSFMKRYESIYWS